MNQFSLSTAHEAVRELNDLFNVEGVVLQGASFTESGYRFSLIWNEDDCEYDVTIEVAE